MNLHRSRLRRLAVRRRRGGEAVAVRDRLAEVEDRDRVLRALQGLPHRQRQAVVLRDFLDHDTETVAGILGVASATVRVLTKQGRDALRRILQEDNGGR